MAALVTQRKGFFELSSFTLDPESIRLLPRTFCRRQAIVVLGRLAPRGTEPAVLGAVYPERLDAFQEAAQLLGRPVEDLWKDFLAAGAPNSPEAQKAWWDAEQAKKADPKK